MPTKSAGIIDRRVDEEAECLEHAEHHEHAGKLAQEARYVGFNRQRLEIDHAQ